MHRSTLISHHASNFESHDAVAAALRRKEKQLQTDLQALLDAQSDGLAAGLGRGPAETASSDDSRSSSRTPHGRKAFSQARRAPDRPRVGLRRARRGILEAMEELASVKKQQSLTIIQDLETTENASGQLDSWDAKRSGLRAKIRDIEGSDEGQRLQQLKSEESQLEIDVREAEIRLQELKASHVRLHSDITSIENSLQAKLSSYKESLSMIEAQTRRFPVTSPLKAITPGTKGEQIAFHALPPDRRTLEVAREHWRDGQKQLRSQHETYETEIEALEDGGVVWQDVVAEVTRFEQQLRDHIHRPISTPSRTATEDTKMMDDSIAAMQRLIETMNGTIARIESKLKLAEARDWRLLVCCIGAELEAFLEGKEVLQETLKPFMDAGLTQEDPDQEEERASIASRIASSHDATRSPSPSTERYHDFVEKSEDEDEGPDPQLMISHQEAD
ncbi:MAG: hypothetical protein M1817_000151 [Caeruleum heppii]|nr:MAG: hypothetical protein M1817_000151 [Caeruleum heppii]